jgi:hypothetical protein
MDRVSAHRMPDQPSPEQEILTPLLALMKKAIETSEEKLALMGGDTQQILEECTPVSSYGSSPPAIIAGHGHMIVSKRFRPTQ